MYMQKRGIELMRLLPIGVQKMYIKEVQKRHGENTDEILFKRYVSLERFIDETLVWDNTSQGHSFWSCISISNFSNIKNHKK
jgi:hypothetical protein